MSKSHLRKSDSRQPRTVIPYRGRELLQVPDLAPGENAEDYRSVIAEVSTALDPQDFIEGIFVQDIADWEWRKRRYKVLGVGLLGSQSATGTDDRMIPGNPESAKAFEDARIKFGGQPAPPSDPEEDAFEKWKLSRGFVQKPTPIPKAETPEDVFAALLKSYKAYSGELERLSRLLAVAENRQKAALTEFDRYREGRSKRGRRQEEILDAEFTEPAKLDVGR